jgi:hypothetical protein
MADTATLPSIAEHGASRLPSVELDSYNIELKDDEGFIGDRASKSAFRDIIENWRKSVRKAGDDPFGDEPSEEISKKTLDTLLSKGDGEAAGIVQGAIEEFSQELALVIRRYLKTKGWKDTERIVIGGGFRASRVGELVIGRTSLILKAEQIDIGLTPIHNDPDQAGLLVRGHVRIDAVAVGDEKLLLGLRVRPAHPPRLPNGHAATLHGLLPQDAAHVSVGEVGLKVAHLIVVTLNGSGQRCRGITVGAFLSYRADREQIIDQIMTPNTTTPIHTQIQKISMCSS